MNNDVGTTSNRSRARFNMRFIEIRLRFVAVLIVTALVISYWSSAENYIERWKRGSVVEQVSDVARQGVVETYSCPMHPFIVRHEPGKCPVCGMTLVKQQISAHKAGEIQVSPTQILQSGIAVDPVGYHLLTRSVRSYAVVEPAEDRMRKIVARFPGRIETMKVNTVGAVVQAGEPLATIYSPKFITAIYEYLQVSAQSGNLEGRLSDFSRERLLLAGLTEKQLSEYEETRKVGRELTLYAPLSGTILERNVLAGEMVEEGTVLYSLADLSRVWVQVLVPEHDSAGIESGMAVEISSEARPGELFYGTVDFISPTVNPENRTVKIRVAIDNQGGELRAGTYVMATIRVPLGGVRAIAEKMPTSEAKKDFTCPMHPEVHAESLGRCPICGMNLVESAPPAGAHPSENLVRGYGCPMHPDELSSEPGSCRVCGCGMEKRLVEREKVLAIPLDAVIDTGLHKFIYVEARAGVFQAREVVLGERVDEFYPVISGVQEGERIAGHGAFLIDADVRIRPVAVSEPSREAESEDEKAQPAVAVHQH